MDMTIANLIRFNEFLDSTINPKELDEDFIALKQVELEGITKNFDGKNAPFVALSYAKLMELIIFLAGTYADNCQLRDFGDLIVNPRHIDVCILNTRLIKDDYGITESIPFWFKREVHESIGSRYSEDRGRMAVDPSLLFRFIEKGLMMSMVKKERHGRLTDQFQDCIIGDPRLAFPDYVEIVTPLEHNPENVLGCGCGMSECLDIRSWLASSTVLNVVKDSLKIDLVDVLCDVISDDYMQSINKRIEKACSALQYTSVGRNNFDNFPYNDGVRISEWNDINHALSHFTLDGYGVIQSELDKTISNPYYRSPYLKRALYKQSEKQDTNAQKDHIFFQQQLTFSKQSWKINQLN